MDQLNYTMLLILVLCVISTKHQEQPANSKKALSSTKGLDKVVYIQLLAASKTSYGA